jgi:hypothetical protein
MQTVTMTKIGIYLIYLVAFLLGRAISVVAPAHGRALAESARIVTEAGAADWLADPSLVKLLDSARDYLGRKCRRRETRAELR